MESIKGNPKFTPLSNDQLKPIYGGGTKGGKEKNGPGWGVTQNGHHYEYTPMRCWDSDYLNEKGMICYEGLTEYVDCVMTW